MAFQVWEGDHWRYVSSWGSLKEAQKEVDRLNRLFNRDYFVKVV